LWRFLVVAGRAFERTRLAKLRIGRRTILAHLFKLVSSFLPSPARINTFWNDTLYLPPKPNFELLILGEGRRDRGTTATLRRKIKTGMTVVDLGANIGVYTLLAASLVGKRGRVYAFEPDPVNYALLEKNVRENGYRNVLCRQQAVSDTSGEALLFKGEYGVSHSLSAFAGVNPGISRTVDTISLDDFFREQGWPPADFIKMNIEGWECFVIAGMTEVLHRSPRLKMILEFNPDLVKKLDVNPECYIKQLEDAGFMIQIIDEEKGLLPFNELNLRHRHGGNILCERR